MSVMFVARLIDGMLEKLGFILVVTGGNIELIIIYKYILIYMPPDFSAVHSCSRLAFL